MYINIHARIAIVPPANQRCKLPVNWQTPEGGATFFGEGPKSKQLLKFATRIFFFFFFLARPRRESKPGLSFAKFCLGGGGRASARFVSLTNLPACAYG